VYTGDLGVSKDEIIAKVKQRFGIRLDPHTLAFIHLRGRWLVEDTTWRRFTLIGQSVGSMLLVVEALQALVPDVFLGKD
jgi:alpha-1,2-mannosyltransferase